MEVLDISYNEMGLSIAKSYHFPEILITDMQHINGESALQPEDNFGRLNIGVNMANDICGCVGSLKIESQPQANSDIEQFAQSGCACHSAQS